MHHSTRSREAAAGSDYLAIADVHYQRWVTKAASAEIWSSMLLACAQTVPTFVKLPDHRVIMNNLNSKQITLIIDELESSFGPKIYCHRALSRDTLQEILGMNWHETIRQNIDRFIWDYQHGATFVVHSPKGRVINVRGPKA